MSFQEQGFDIRKNFLEINKCKYFILEIESKINSVNNYGIRNIDRKIDAISSLALSKYLLNSASNYLSGNPVLVRAIYFNKTFNNNWSVPWHQDKTIAVNKRIDLPEYKAWSIKENINYVQPPLAVLEDMVTFRIHLDPANQTNGCLRVVPGTHKLGILNQSEINRIKNTYPIVPCEADAGDVVVIRPLHSSLKALVASNRRVIHLEYSSFQLPGGLTWVK